MKLGKAEEMVTSGIEGTLCYMAFPREHWRNLRTNNPLARLIKEVRRRIEWWEPSPMAKVP